MKDQHKAGNEAVKSDLVSCNTVLKVFAPANENDAAAAALGVSKHHRDHAQDSNTICFKAARDAFTPLGNWGGAQSLLERR